MRRCLMSVIVLLLGAISSVASAQTDSGHSWSSQVQEMQQLLNQYEKQRIYDSLRIAQLANDLQAKSLLSANGKKENTEDNEGDSLSMAIQKQELEMLKRQSIGYPVTLFADTIMELFTPIGAYSPQQRAEETHLKILSLYNRSDFVPDSLKLSKQFGQYNLHYESNVILTVNNYDALWMDMDLDVLASYYLENIKFSIVKNKELHTWEQIALRWAQIILILVIAYLVWLIVKKSLAKLVHFLKFNKNNIVKDIKIKKYELIDRKFLLKSLIRIVGVIRTILLLVIIYFAITFILNVFAETQKYTHQLWSYIFDPVREVMKSIIDYIPNLLRIIAIFFVFRYVLRGIRYFSIEIEKGDLKLRRFHPEWAKTTYHIFRILLVAFAIILVFPYLPGSDTDAFRGVSVFAGVLISFGSSSAISNTIAGFVLTYMRPFKTGDWIKVGDDVGKVVEKTLLVTRIQTINNEDITIPNSSILSKHTKNYSTNYENDGLVITAEVTFAYAVDWHVIHEVLLNAAKKTKFTNQAKAPYVFQNKLAEYYVTYQINVYTQQPDKMYFIHTELLQHIQEGFKEAGLDLHLPAQISIVP